MMKKLIFLFLGLFPLVGQSQNFLKWAVHETDSIVIADADSTLYNKVAFYTLEPWSMQVNFGNVDSTDATTACDLYVYCSGSTADSSLYDLLWADNNLDGVNDNPWELSSTLNPFLCWTISGNSFPYANMHIEVERDNVPATRVIYLTFTRSRTERKQ